MYDLGKTVLIANPAAKAGRARGAVRHIEAAFRAALGPESFQTVLTNGPGHAAQLAAGLPRDVRTLVVLGGDGAVHEAANGLMQRPREDRPALAVLPAGSGNDYAATLGMSMKLGTATRQILRGRRVQADVGECNGVYFVETLSFGLDAAIALATVQLRQETGASGTALYARAGIDQLLHHRDLYSYDLSLEDAEGRGGSLRLQGQSFVFAVQIGPTYGGHFRISPRARIDDGLFDLCIVHPPFTAAQGIAIFARAKGGHHERDPRVEVHTAAAMAIRFDRAPAAQIDGEKIEGCDFRISMHPGAIDVVAARR